MQNGFTLIELIIVLAIMTILGAIAVPSFTNISDKTRLKADIQSAIAINEAKDLYEIETGKEITGAAETVVQELHEKGYLNQEYKTQTNSSKFSLDNGKIKVDISGCGSSIKDLYDNLGENEKLYVTGISSNIVPSANN